MNISGNFLINENFVGLTGGAFAVNGWISVTNGYGVYDLDATHLGNYNTRITYYFLRYILKIIKKNLQHTDSF
jgi:hypothetical protein